MAMNNRDQIGGEIVSTDDLALLLAALPPRVRFALEAQGLDNLLEVVLDLGRPAEARFAAGPIDLGDEPVTAEDIAYVVERIGAFGDDNRAGIGRTLHRISAIRNRNGQVVGLTCRVGRAVRGTVELVRDVIEDGRSVLILGRPGVGKTTLLREAARVLADELGKRVVVVDTSNEIAGDGDVPHPGIGRARRMQVARVAEQHTVMIEAVENHMPEVIVIDEIGAELEAQAARTIAERGVQLIGTAHGRTLENLLLNPTLSDLVGGIQAVTLGDEEARRRGTQKTVLERKAPPTFDVLVEQEERHLLGIHNNVAGAVDELLRGEAPQREMRERLPDGSIRKWTEHVQRTSGDGVGLPAREAPPQREETSRRSGSGAVPFPARRRAPHGGRNAARRPHAPARAREVNRAEAAGASFSIPAGAERPLLAEREQRATTENGARKRRIFPLGVNRSRLDQAIRQLGGSSPDQPDGGRGRRRVRAQEHGAQAARSRGGGALGAGARGHAAQ